MYCIVLYCIVLYCIVLYCIVLYCIVLYCFVLYCIVLYCIVLYCIVLYCIVLYCIVLYCIVLYCIVLYCSVLCCVELCCIVLYCHYCGYSLIQTNSSSLIGICMHLLNILFLLIGPCMAGHYCSRYSSKEWPCKEGTYSNVTGLFNSSGCRTCPMNSYCVKGSIAPIRCPMHPFFSHKDTTIKIFEGKKSVTDCKQCPVDPCDKAGKILAEFGL